MRQASDLSDQKQQSGNSIRLSAHSGTLPLGTHTAYVEKARKRCIRIDWSAAATSLHSFLTNKSATHEVKLISGFSGRPRQLGIASATQHRTNLIKGRARVCCADVQKRAVRRSSAREKWRAAWRCRTSAQSRCLQVTASYHLPASHAIAGSMVKSVRIFKSVVCKFVKILLSFLVYILQWLAWVSESSHLLPSNPRSSFHV